MVLTTTNYFDRVKGVDWAKLPEALRKAHDLTSRVGKAGIPWDNYHASAPIRSMIDNHFAKMEQVLAAQEKSAGPAKPAAAPKASKPTKALKAAKPAAAPKAPKLRGGDTVSFDYRGVTIEGRVQPYTGGPPRLGEGGRYEVRVPSLNRDVDLLPSELTLVHRHGSQPKHVDEKRPNGVLPGQKAKTPAEKAAAEAYYAEKSGQKPAAAPKAAKAPKAPKAEFPEIGYYNAKGEPVNGRVDPDKLYYLQPDGSYEKGGDSRGPGWVKKPKKAKTPKPKKVDTRKQVPHLSAEVQFFQKFLRLVDKPVTIEQVQRVHASLEKGITKQQVRVSSKHADDLTEVARLVASTYETMLERGVGSISKLEIDNPVVGRARALVASVRVATATTLLSRFINMQGQEPDRKAVESLKTALHNEYEENPDGDHALAIGAAHAVLVDWKPGRPVRITKQQLSGLAGLMSLGCPDVPGKPCGCGPKKARR